MKKFDFAIVGGDKRTAHMATLLAKRGYNVIRFGTAENPIDNKIYTASTFQEAITNAPVIVCGIPFQKDGYLYFEKQLSPIPLTELQRMLRKHHTVFGGVIPEDFRTVCESRTISCFDFLQAEPLTIMNAVATAEGAILEALLHKDTQLHLSKTLVLGYGRCAKVLADFEYIFNTIPTMVLTRPCLEKMRQDSLIIDIASNRVGVDYEAADSLQRAALFCPGLPGKYSCLSCAKQLVEFVLKKCNFSK